MAPPIAPVATRPALLPKKPFAPAALARLSQRDQREAASPAGNRLDAIRKRDAPAASNGIEQTRERLSSVECQDGVGAETADERDAVAS
jgi:hypothetical protein